jgi:hypothetical protein
LVCDDRLTCWLGSISLDLQIWHDQPKRSLQKQWNFLSKRTLVWFFKLLSEGHLIVLDLLVSQGFKNRIYQ